MAVRLNPHVLDDARDRWGLTSDARLAAKLGVAPGTVGHLRKGDTEPTVRVLLKLRALTGWPLDGLVTEVEDTAAA
ncbi:helix-turn-helix domain-containing protein [Corynebacterium variabile]|nr:helix-turn-helix transcriptional regulator [Corynebacterium variabile]